MQVVQIEIGGCDLLQQLQGLLNKLRMENFNSISDLIIACVNKSETEKDGKTLKGVIRLVFEMAIDDATQSKMYASLCRRMIRQISPRFEDDGVKDAKGIPIGGAQLFSKYLLNRCQEDLECRWMARDATAATAAAKAMGDQAAKAADEKSKESSKTGDEIVLHSEEYYAAQKTMRQCLDLVEFIGELFKLHMLTEQIMHECMKKLLEKVENPEEEVIESLCELLATVGASLDTHKAREQMDTYFMRMKELAGGDNVSSRSQDMLQARELFDHLRPLSSCAGRTLLSFGTGDGSAITSWRMCRSVKWWVDSQGHHERRLILWTFRLPGRGPPWRGGVIDDKCLCLMAAHYIVVSEEVHSHRADPDLPVFLLALSLLMAVT